MLRPVLVACTVLCVSHTPLWSLNAACAIFVLRYHSAVVTCTGDPATFAPFVLHGDTVYFEFRSACSAGDGSWGYRFHASPMQGLLWLSEHEVLHACR